MLKYGILLVIGAVCVASEESQCKCTREYNPVCGSDGVSYSSPCMFECAKQNKPDLKSKPGKCEKEEQPCICNEQYLPICGSDGKTYPNECSYNCEKKNNPNLNKKFYGECQEKKNEEEYCVCPYIYLPVCGSDGKSYPNECSLNCERKKNGSIKKEYDGECKKKEEECVCTDQYLPICGSDGKTYPNECSYNCERRNNPYLDKHYYGECNKDMPIRDEQCICTYIYQPICGSDGRTYPNECSLNCARKYNPYLKWQYSGECDQGKQNKGNEETLCSCTREFRQVCGTDGRTYNNPCLLKCSTKNNSGLQIKHYGPCERQTYPKCVCTRIYEPVCGKDGVTYSNKCMMECRGQEMKSYGRCEDKKQG